MNNTKYLKAVPFAERLEKEDKFFSKPFVLSFSGLSKLIYSPALFYHHYVLEQKDDTKTQQMIEGSLIHCLLLKPENFDDEYILSLESSPTDSQKEVLHRLYKHHTELKKEDSEHSKKYLFEYDRALEDILSDMNLYQSMKQPTRLAKMINEQTQNYWEYLKNADGKTIIDHDVYDYANSIVEKIKSDSVIMDVMGFFKTSFDNVEKHNELMLFCMSKDDQFALKGIIDNLVIDHDNKEIRINDLKKSSKGLSQFEDSIDFYKYWLQASIYKQVVMNTICKDYTDYQVTFRFIVADQYMQIASIKISDDTMKEWDEKAKLEIEKANYHFSNRNFSLPYDYLVNGGEFTI